MVSRTGNRTVSLSVIPTQLTSHPPRVNANTLIDFIMHQERKMAFVTASLMLASLIMSSVLLIFSGGESFAQQRSIVSVDRAVALPLTTAEGNQVKVIINYDIEDESLLGQRINAIMGIYDRNNGSLIKLSSFPNGFILNNTEGSTHLATSLTDPVIQNISAIVTLTNADKSEKYSNDVRADLDLRTILPTTLPPLQSLPAEEETEEDQENISNDDDVESNSENEE